MDSDGNKVYERATLAFQKLSPMKGDIIVINFPADIEPLQMQIFAEQLEPHIPAGVTILCSRSGVTIQNLPEAQLNDLGWYKFDSNKKAN